MKVTVSRCLALFTGPGLLAWGVAGGFPQRADLPEPTPEQAVFFESKIRPVLADNCFSCHGDKVQMAGLRLDTRAGAEKGGDSGLLFGKDSSLLLKAIRHEGPIKMPKGRKLAAAQIADLEAWVGMGAPWPKANDPVVAKKAEPLWSLRPVSDPKPPKVAMPTWVRNPVDRFILAKLETKRLAPAPEADRRTLLRRVTFDLTGLPPTPAEVDAFRADKSPNAYERVVDRLLASPRYGERWARLWLDVARYSDTKGYVFNEDRLYPNAYTYRDWVINALNSDLPYDQFIVKQLAADRLVSGPDQKDLAALGFLTVGRRFLNIVPDIIDDRIDVTMRGFQGFTVACARCHDHKFDPVPTQDYYSLYAVFDSSDEASVPISPPAIRDPWLANAAKISAGEKEGKELILAETARLRKVVLQPNNGLAQPVKDALQTLREGEVAQGDHLPRLLPAFQASERSRLMNLQAELERLRKTAPPTPEFAMAMNDRGEGHDGVVFRRGNPGNPGEAAPRRFLKALSPEGDRPLWRKGSGRLELARAIADPANPLTARVIVNRLWMHHFGEGLVRTPSDFGRQGDLPTHPELLDYLAKKLVQDGWSLKKMHRLMVTSATYRQSSEAKALSLKVDPENRLLSRAPRRRLDLEQMRDSVMAVAAKLDIGQVGGKSVDLWSTPFTGRRATYGFVERQNLPGIFRTFDFASPDTTSPRRFRTTVPQQALFFLNSPFLVEAAKSVASRPEVLGASNEGQRIRRLYRLLFGRLPDPTELEAGTQFLSAPQPRQPESDWSYGYGRFDSDTQRVAGFTPLTNFANDRYQGGTSFPDPTLGYVFVNADGGHPGNDVDHAVIRRWTAPSAMRLTLTGRLAHGQGQGDGVRARLVSNRQGLLAEWTAKNQTVDTNREVSVSAAEILDFVVDPIGGPAFDAFAWVPTLRSSDLRQTWGRGDFGPPTPEISRRALYVQALLMTNEFLFVD